MDIWIMQRSSEYVFNLSRLGLDKKCF